MNNLRHQMVLGDDEFVKRLKAGQIVADRTEISRPQRKGVALALHEYRSGFDDRSEAMARAYVDGAYTMAEIAEHFSMHYKTVSRAVQKFEAGGFATVGPAAKKCPNVRPDNHIANLLPADAGGTVKLATSNCT